MTCDECILLYEKLPFTKKVDSFDAALGTDSVIDETIMWHNVNTEVIQQIRLNTLNLKLPCYVFNYFCLIWV